MMFFQVKQSACSEFHKGAGQLVADAMRTLSQDVLAPDSYLPDKSSLERAANRAREALRPKHPTTIDFEVISFYLFFTIID